MQYIYISMHNCAKLSIIFKKQLKMAFLSNKNSPETLTASELLIFACLPLACGGLPHFLNFASANFISLNIPKITSKRRTTAAMPVSEIRMAVEVSEELAALSEAFGAAGSGSGAGLGFAEQSGILKPYF